MAEQINWEKKDSIEDIKIILAKILRKWYWIVLALIIAIISAFLFIRYQDPVYVVKASFISRKFDSRGASVLPTLSDVGGFNDRIEVNQQIPLLKSENRINETINRLGFDVSYFVEGRLKTTELYKTCPYKVTTIDSSKSVPYNQEIYLQKVNEHSYMLSSTEEHINRRFKDKTFLFNADQSLGGWNFNISHANGNGINAEYSYYFIIHHPRTLMSAYRSKLNLHWAYKNSAILTASVNTEIPEKDFDFLSTYLQVVIDLGLEEKNEYLVNTINFIDRYMGDITDTLLNFEGEIDDFRLTNREKISESTLIIGKLNSLDEQKSKLLLEDSYYNYIEDYIKQNKEESIFAPNLIGIEVPPLGELVRNYMEIRWQDQLNKNEFNDKNPLVIRRNEKYELLEENIYESVKNLKELNEVRMKEIKLQSEFYIQSVGDLQVEYREFTNKERMKSLYENLHNQLLARKTDAYISMASATSDYQMVTEPYYSKIPISPNINKIYIIAIFLGLGFPIGFIFLFDLINPKIVSKEDLKKHTDIPIIGTVGHYVGKTNLVVNDHPKSQISESFRVIRANLEYMNPDNEDAKVILLTSSISGEGKTFCSINVAYTYANMGKKTVLVGADMRRPALSKNFGMERSHGLSNYLSGQDELKDVIYASKKEGLDIIPGGHVPPNPAELLTSSRMSEMVTFIKKHYEIIIFDTPPIGLVSDTVELVKHSSIPLIVVRQNVTYKKSLDAITEMYHSGKFKQLGIIMNDVNYTKFDYGAYYGNSYGYGSAYGYGYYDDEPKKSPFWKKSTKS